MYKNYGDANFFENGVLVEVVNETTFNFIRCGLDSDTGKYLFNPSMQVDINDSLIDREAVMSYIGMTENDFDPLFFAIGCTDYYSWENFGIPYGQSDNELSGAEITEILENYDIDRTKVTFDYE